MSLYDIVVARKLSGGGGGGSSDFSTAKVTVVDNTSGINWNLPYIVDGQISAIVGSFGTQGGGTSTIMNVPLYKGNLGVIIPSHLTVTTSGDVQLLGGSTYLITGDCTITVG